MEQMIRKWKMAKTADARRHAIWAVMGMKTKLRRFGRDVIGRIVGWDEFAESLVLVDDSGCLHCFKISKIKGVYDER